MAPVKIAVMGAGLIGKRHAAHVRAQEGALLSAIIDPAPAGKTFAEEIGVAWYPAFGALPAGERPDGVIVATPNQLHVANGLELASAGIPMLVEKPIADSVDSARELVLAAEAAGVPLLVGHHRRHNPMIRKARETIDAGRLGRVLTLTGQFWLVKPDEYFEVEWRRQEGAGPILINLIHDIDLFRYLCGEIVGVQAQSSHAVRGNPAEETAVAILRFANGALGTVSASDTVVSPWSWELTTGENPAYPRQDQSCYQIGGTQGSLTIPALELWNHTDRRGWWEPLKRERIPFVPEDPLQAQIRHFCAVIRGEEEPLVSGREGLATLAVIEAVKQAARSGGPVEVAAEPTPARASA
ncbi:Gfo/Idh/MocA family protein [Bosea sp. CER48]|uniref:Gfo/Idh/MocA family protein n=1 Tax=Bosea sp. CER48 TaxID=3377035 RepID=UPI0038278DC5